jgi:hypothetical protein
MFAAGLCCGAVRMSMQCGMWAMRYAESIDRVLAECGRCREEQSYLPHFYAIDPVCRAIYGELLERF